MSNNDIVINKLTQILSYLRHSKRDLKRQKKKGMGMKQRHRGIEQPLGPSGDPLFSAPVQQSGFPVMEQE